jgi:RHS repeat-associated protein
MKKILIPMGALLISGLAQGQLTNTENYVYSKTYLDYNGTTPTKTSETVQYFDGLGRPKQVVNIKASPLGKDVVTPIVYDGFGRQVKDYLPVPQSSTLNGAIIADPLANVTNTPYSTEKIYAEKVLENSPLDRILQQKQVGNAWDNKPVQFQYDANTVADGVRKFTTTTIWENGATKTTLGENWLFTDGQLYKNTVTDEDGNKTIEFKNGQGQVVMVRKIVSDTESADTYYVYNEYNQLAYVIPPLASIRGDIVTNTTKHDELCYQYRYDGRNRLVEKKLPGKGWEYMLYDKQDRLVATQDTVLKEKGQWLYTKYDQFGRVAITGIGTGYQRSVEQVTVDSFGSNNVTRINTPFFNRQGIDVYYNNPDGSWPNSSNWVTLLSLNYYDSYPGYYFNPSFPTDILGETTLTDTPTAEGLSTKSLPVMSLVKNIEDDNWTKNYTYYDKKGRAIGSYSINHLGGYTKMDSKLDFAGMVKQSITRHKRLNGDTDKIITENFTYDHQNRLLSHTHQIDTNPVEYLAQNSYNEISQITNKKVGGGAPSSPLQSVDYAYNIRGWMTKINDPANLSGKLYGYEMKYQNPQSGGWIPKYNGNISEIDWKSSQDDVLRRYNYEYDPLNRLVGGYYLEPNSSIVWVGYFHEYYNYDLNGNITRLVRMGKPVAPQTTAQQIDELIYTYAGNRLITVSDASQNNSGYPLGGSTISYDVNGNMTNHLDKGISLIQYNYQNLPKQITSSLGNTSYIYRADGGKVKKIFGSKITDYLDGFQYENAVLKFFPTSEGYFNFENNKYIYNYTDHLGNIRISYFNNGSGVEVLEENNYYPFGLKHEGYNGLAGNPSYQYKYNGKELQETGMYDYGARMYMPDLGRWGVVDPLAEKMTRHSPYNYAFNNPIRFVDPDGRQGTDWIRKGGTWEYNANVTTAEQAQQMSGVDGFAKNGTVLSDAKIGADGEAGYVRLNEGGSAEYLPEGPSNALVAFSNSMPMFAGGTWTTWTHEEFPQLTDPGGMARNDFDAGSWDKKFADDKLFTLDIGNIPIPGNASTLRLPNIAEIFKNLESIGFTDAPDWYKFKSQPDTLFMKATFVGSGKDFLRDTMFAEPYRKNETTEQVLNRQNKKFDSVKAKSKTFLTR